VKVNANYFVLRYIDYHEATEISRCEEEFQAEIWGTVEGGHDLDRLNNRVSLSSVDTFMSLYWSDEKVAAKMASWKKDLAMM
jgi:chaperone required for assembly of F1-ATPase